MSLVHVPGKASANKKLSRKLLVAGAVATGVAGTGAAETYRRVKSNKTVAKAYDPERNRMKRSKTGEVLASLSAGSLGTLAVLDGTNNAKKFKRVGSPDLRGSGKLIKRPAALGAAALGAGAVAAATRSDRKKGGRPYGAWYS